MQRKSDFASLTLLCGLLVACGGNPPPKESGGEPGTEQPREDDPPEAPTVRQVGKPGNGGGPKVTILRPRNRVRLTKLPVSVDVEVIHDGELRSCRLGRLKGKQISRTTLKAGSVESSKSGSSGLGGSVADGDQTFTVVVDGGSDGAKTIARARVARKAIERILAEWTFNALRGARRTAVVQATLKTLRREKFKERSGGKWRFSAVINMPEARNLVLDALAVQETWGADPYVLAVCGDRWWGGSKLGSDEVDGIRLGITSGAADWLNRWRFTQAPGAKDRALLLKKASALGVKPTAAELQGFSGSFEAGLVVALSGGIKFERFSKATPQTKGFQGYLRVRGLTCTVYQRSSNTILATFAVRSEGGKTTESDATTSSVHQPWVAKGASISAEAERYGQFLGRTVASNVCRRLFDRYYSHSSAAPAGGVECPGCGDRVSADLAECPTCASPLKGLKKAAKPLGVARYRTVYRFMLAKARDGENKIRAVATDAKGRKGSDESSFFYYVPDVTPPVIKLVKPRDGASVSTQTVEVIVEVTDDQQVKTVEINGNSLRAPKGSSRRLWNAHVDFKLRAGVNRIAVVATDMAGNVGRAFAKVTYVAPDVTAPKVKIKNPRDGAALRKGPITVVVEATDDKKVDSVTLNGAAMRHKAGSRYEAQINPAEGKNQLVVVATDRAGNAGKSVANFTFTIPDTTPPSVSILAPRGKKALTNAPVIVAVKASDDKKLAWVKINGVKAVRDAAGRYKVKIAKPVDGANEIVAIAMDTSGNQAEAKGEFLFDSTPPEVSANARLLVEGKVDDLKATLTINGVAVSYDKKTGKYSVRVPPHKKHPGKIEIIATDEIGNTRREFRKVR
jgi:hypothetical protein